jgi:hypothetical protein
LTYDHTFAGHRWNVEARVPVGEALPETLELLVPPHHVERTFNIVSLKANYDPIRLTCT